MRTYARFRLTFPLENDSKDFYEILDDSVVTKFERKQ
jgi:hypothetical protein